MASITKRTLKSGKVVYEIRVYRGVDPTTGKQNKPFSKRIHPPLNVSEEELESLLRREARLFEDKCLFSSDFVPSKNVTFRKYAFQAVQCMSLAPGSLENYKHVIEIASRQFGNLPMNGVLPQIIRNYLLKLQNGSLMEQNNGLDRKLAWNTVGMHYTVLHKVFSMAVEDQILIQNPMQGIKKPKPRKDEHVKEPNSYNEAEAQHLIKCMELEPAKWRAFVVFLLDSGCRRGEAIALQWANVDLNSGKVTIKANAQYTRDRGVYITTPKNGRARVIFLNKEALDELKQWHEEQTIAYGECAFVFTGKKGKMLHPQSASTYFTMLGRKYNIVGLHPHALRHTMASLSIANGADIVSVSNKLGHTNPSITLNVYSHVNEEAQRKANAVLRIALYGSGEQPNEEERKR